MVSTITGDDGSVYMSKQQQQYPRGSRYAASSTVLPPLPWQLLDDKHRRKYEQHTGSAFIKGIRTKAQQVAILAHHESMIQHQHQHQQETITDDLSLQWRYATGKTSHSKSTNDLDGSHRSQKHRNYAKGTNNSRRSKSNKQFDAQKFLHPWQRQLEQMKKEYHKSTDENIHHSQEMGITIEVDENGYKKIDKNNFLFEKKNSDAEKPYHNSDMSNMEKSNSMNTSTRSKTLPPLYPNRVRAPEKVTSNDVNSIRAYSLGDLFEDESKSAENHNTHRSDFKSKEHDKNASKAMAGKSVSFHDTQHSSLLSSSLTKNDRYVMSPVIHEEKEEDSDDDVSDLDEDEEEEDEDEEDDEGIGWSPFLIPSS